MNYFTNNPVCNCYTKVIVSENLYGGFGRTAQAAVQENENDP
jgi:hypothetical protein